MDYGFLYFTTIGNLVFADNDVKVTNEGVLDAKTHEPIPYCVSWGLVAPIRFALTEEYVLEPSENPYFRYIKNRVMKKGYEDIQRNAGIEETIWYSPNKSYTPMWLEVNGYKLYNFNEHNAEKTSSRFQVQDGIRYYNGVPCINDVFKVYGIDKEIIFGEYEGFTYIEIK
jgi:hypothetical protein